MDPFPPNFDQITLENHSNQYFHAILVTFLSHSFQWDN